MRCLCRTTDPAPGEGSARGCSHARKSRQRTIPFPVSDSRLLFKGIRVLRRPVAAVDDALVRVHHDGVSPQVRCEGQHARRRDGVAVLSPEAAAEVALRSLRGPRLVRRAQAQLGDGPAGRAEMDGAAAVAVGQMPDQVLDIFGAPYFRQHIRLELFVGPVMRGGRRVWDSSM